MNHIMDDIRELWDRLLDGSSKEEPEDDPPVIDYDGRIVDAIAEAFGETPERTERTLVNAGIMAPPLEPKPQGWYVTRDGEWLLLHDANGWRWWDAYDGKDTGSGDWNRMRPVIGADTPPPAPLDSIIRRADGAERLKADIDGLVDDLEREKRLVEDGRDTGGFARPRNWDEREGYRQGLERAVGLIRGISRNHTEKEDRR